MIADPVRSKTSERSSSNFEYYLLTVQQMRFSVRLLPILCRWRNRSASTCYHCRPRRSAGCESVGIARELVTRSDRKSRRASNQPSRCVVVIDGHCCCRRTSILNGIEGYLVCGGGKVAEHTGHIDCACTTCKSLECVRKAISIRCLF
jgi:hypothetical protein